MVVDLVWLMAMTAGMGWWVWRDFHACRAFQALTDTKARQAMYWQWLVQSFVILVGASLVSLWLAKGLIPFSPFPAEFGAAKLALHPQVQPGSGDAMAGMTVGLAVGLGILLLVQYWRLRKMMRPMGGTADAILPRNRREAGIVLLLSVNAGFSEELFFRLALPLLLLKLTGSLPAAFLLAGIGFGLAHAYQGWKGIAGTMIAGGMLTFVYLSHGSLLRVMILHAAIDVVALLVRPALSRWLARGTRLTPALG